ncbi:MAG: polyprenyl synthetase family protein [Pseudomonadota bacterium]
MLREVLSADTDAIANHLTAQISGRSPLHAAMRYAVEGGKRLRGVMVLETARLHDVAADRALWPAGAIEAMHAYSLVHDDLPCIDNDATRRGRPTVHVKWDAAMAVLVGDALQSLAFEMALHPAGALSPAARAELGSRLALAAGAGGMVAGQAMDIAAETAPIPLTLEEITTLQAGKTGALFVWSATSGAVMAEADTAPFEAYANAVGLAFQIQDDVIDVTGDSAEVGKAVGKDAAAGKATFVSLLGLEAARRRADTLVDEACDALAGYGARADKLIALARYIVARSH